MSEVGYFPVKDKYKATQKIFQGKNMFNRNYKEKAIESVLFSVSALTVVILFLICLFLFRDSLLLFKDYVSSGLSHRKILVSYFSKQTVRIITSFFWLPSCYCRSDNFCSASGNCFCNIYFRDCTPKGCRFIETFYRDSGRDSFCCIRVLWACCPGSS